MVAPPENAHHVHMDRSITPEAELEQVLPGDPRLGVALAAIPSDDPLRGDPRFLALVHDSCKAEVPPHPQWSPDHDHPTLVRRFAERYAVDERLLSTLELHDEPFWLWRHDAAPEQALRLLLEQLPNPGLFARFVVELDAADEGKDLTFLRRFRRELAIAGRLPTHSATATNRGRSSAVARRAGGERARRRAAAHLAHAWNQ